MRPTGPLARGDVSVSFLTETGAYWGPFVQPATDPADAVRPCYKRAIDEDPRVTGWIRVRIAATQGPASFEADLVDSSELPTPLTSCVVAAIRSLGGNGQWLPPRIAYVSLR